MIRTEAGWIERVSFQGAALFFALQESADAHSAWLEALSKAWVYFASLLTLECLTGS